MVSHFGIPPLMPYCSIHSLEQGGGVLFNAYTHFLAQAQYVSSGGLARSATGRTDGVMDRVPVGPPLHDFRRWAPVDPAQAEAGEWRGSDADFKATVLTGIELADGREITGLFHASALVTGRHVGYLALHGTTGTLHLDGEPWFTRLEQFSVADGRWADIAFPADDDPTQSGWNHLVADLVADVLGVGNQSYPTFRDGYLANQLIDQVRETAALGHTPVSPSRWAAATSSERRSTPSLARRFDTCRSAVRWLMNSRAPICRSVRPWQTRPSTSDSRG